MKRRRSAGRCDIAPLSATRAIAMMLSAIGLATVGAVTGCAQPNPYAFAPPPIVAAPAAGAAASDAQFVVDNRRTVIVVGEFANPDFASLKWNNIGKGVSDALGRTMFNQGRYEIWLRPELSREIDAVLRRSPAQRSKELARLGRANPDVDYVLLGKVTDFAHTRDLNASMGRRSFFGKRMKEAFVALQLDLVDLKTQRIIGIGHLYGTAPADDHPTDKSYASVRITNYLFWSTPLGKASAQVINRAIDHLNTIIPKPVRELRIVQMLDTRTAQISGGTDCRVVRGERFYVLQRAGPGEELVPVLDTHTRMPLQIRIEQVDSASSTGWMIGQMPEEVAPEHTVLDRQLPAAPMTPAAAPAQGAGAGVVSVKSS